MSRNIYNIYLCTKHNTSSPVPPPTPPLQKKRQRKEKPIDSLNTPSGFRLLNSLSSPSHSLPLTLASKHPSRIKYPRIKQLMPPQPDIHSRNPLSGLLHPSSPPIPIRIHTPFLLLHTDPIHQPLQLLPQPHTPQ